MSISFEVVNTKKMPIDITSSALENIIKLQKTSNKTEKNIEYLRIAVRPGGCSGFSYEMFFDTSITSLDTIFKYPNLQVIMDAESLTKLEGTTLDYLNTMTESGFKLDNPNAARTCGCGKSFS
jgi:iron-sulfur cluster assembly protein/iron-sulfur cluster insertion protein